MTQVVPIMSRFIIETQFPHCMRLSLLAEIAVSRQEWQTWFHKHRLAESRYGRYGYWSKHWTKRGYLDNREQGRVTGEIEVAQFGKIELELEGDMSGTIRGKQLEFENPEYNETFNIRDPYGICRFPNISAQNFFRSQFREYRPPLRGRVEDIVLNQQGDLWLGFSTLKPGCTKTRLDYWTIFHIDLGN